MAPSSRLYRDSEVGVKWPSANAGVRERVQGHSGEGRRRWESD